ncbi:hypothetical protein BN1708_009621 [Verticillium longisporum]|uniref:3-hydroxyacyl-CoA dehydrogenase NAD binding domain-containing protein n=1 Tax=Verticillium longisporum TaxID=100787 RepID=A0A0G4KJ02_VERLO|nr:hypothetical protein BN1708_009621 [Verticillium longisporum]
MASTIARMRPLARIGSQARYFSSSLRLDAAAKVQRLGVIGAGQMGLGIALVAAQKAQVPVTVVDTSEASLKRGIAFAEKLLAKDVAKSRITQEQADHARSLLTPVSSLDKLSDVDFVIEAVPEIPKLKFDIFAQLADICPKHAILATNTSRSSRGAASSRAALSRIGSGEKLLAKDVAKSRITQEQADHARSLLTPVNSLDKLSDVDFVIEAVPEIPKLKFDIFAQLAEICPKHAILATNTSSISITSIAAATTKNPTDTSASSRVVSTHFMNPVPVQKGVEIISGLQTSQDTLDTAIEFCRAMGKITLSSASKRPICPKHAILATNTSSISITSIAAATTKNPTDTSASSRVVSTHFMNPVPVQKGVEIISGLQTSQDTLDTAIEFCRAMGKITSVSADSPGFLANRILMPYINEAVICLETAVGDRDSIDAIMKNGTNVPMGPLQLADFIGLDTCLAIMKVLHEETGDSKYRPSVLLRKMVDAGWLGKKSGKGFYDY